MRIICIYRRWSYLPIFSSEIVHTWYVKRSSFFIHCIKFESWWRYDFRLLNDYVTHTNFEDCGGALVSAWTQNKILSFDFVKVLCTFGDPWTFLLLKGTGLSFCFCHSFRCPQLTYYVVCPIFWIEIWRCKAWEIDLDPDAWR
jgi:hypothetical protein